MIPPAIPKAGTETCKKLRKQGVKSFCPGFHGPQPSGSQQRGCSHDAPGGKPSFPLLEVNAGAGATTI